ATAAGAQEARAFTVDLTDAVSLQRLTASVEREMGPAELLIVNGGGPKPGTFTQTAPADWDAAYALTLQSALRLVHAVLPGMRARKWGRIVALESVVVKQPFAGMVLSNALRASVTAALKTLSSEVASEGITVNTIATGVVETDRFRSLYDTPSKMAAAAAGLPMNRAASPAEDAPTFENTIVAMERTGLTLDRVSTIYGIYTSTMNDAKVQAIETEMAPKLAAFNDKIFQNGRLFARIAAVYEARDRLGLNPEQE